MSALHSGPSTCHAVILSLTVAALSGNCGGVTGGDTDTSTDWLKRCAEDDECGADLVCGCGICTELCEQDSDCHSLSRNAVCAPAPETCVQAVSLCVDAEVFSAADAAPIAGPYAITGSYPAACRSQCELASGECKEPTFDAVPDYVATKQAWDDDLTCGISVLRHLEGTCDSGLQFLYHHTGHTSEVRYFDDSGAFVGLATGTDVIDPECQGRSYWPEPVLCGQPQVTQVRCGTFSQFRLAWANGTANGVMVEVPESLQPDPTLYHARGARSAGARVARSPQLWAPVARAWLGA